MNAKRVSVIKIIGLTFIITPLLYLLVTPAVISYHSKILASFKNSSAIFSGAYLGRFMMILFVLATGAGVLRFKPWAYYCTLFIPVIGILNIVWDIWFFGTQYYEIVDIIIFISAYIFIYLFFANKQTADVFSINKNNASTIKSFPKVLTLLVVVLIVMHAVSILIWRVYINTRYKDFSATIAAKPAHVTYNIEDKEFILNNFSKYDIFDFTIMLPTDFRVAMIYKSLEFGWEVVLIDAKDSSMPIAVFLNSKGASYLEPLRRTLKFNSVYELEKKLNYPVSSPLYITLKMSGDLKRKQIEEVNALGWRGFVKTGYSQQRDNYILDCSLHSFDGAKTAGAVFNFQETAIEVKQVKTILASVRFMENAQTAAELFNKGKIALDNKNYNEAIFSFLNALYRNDTNSIYAYYLAYALLQDDRSPGLKTRLNSARNFLLYSLNIQPGNLKVRELLGQVNNRIEADKNNR